MLMLVLLPAASFWLVINYINVQLYSEPAVSLPGRAGYADSADSTA